MGFFLLEEICEEKLFKDVDKEELQKRLIETLLEFGECAIEQISLFGKKIYVYDSENLKKEGDCYVLNYNRFENDTWEPAYMHIALEKFEGVRSRVIGSKTGCQQHYRAMAISRVLCECYSSGNYYVIGDIGMESICRCLAYIGKKYGFGLVEKCVEYRTDWDTVKEKEYFDDIFWGERRYSFYFHKFSQMTFSEWKSDMKSKFSGDLKEVESSGKYTYCGTGVYLASLYLNHLCEKELADIMCGNKEEIINALRLFLQKYYINAIELKWEDVEIHSFDYLQFEDLVKYKLFYMNLDEYTYTRVFADEKMFYKTIENYIDALKRSDSNEIMDKLQEMLDEMVPSKENVCYMEKDDPQKVEWLLYLALKAENNQDKIKQKLMDRIMNIIETSDDISEDLFFDDYSKEIDCIKRTGKPMTCELMNYLMTIFSEERKAKYNAAKCQESELISDNNISAIIKLMNTAEKLCKEFVLLPSRLFYNLLEQAFCKERIDIIDKIDFYLNDLPDASQKKFFLEVIENEELCDKLNFV